MSKVIIPCSCNEDCKTTLTINVIETLKGTHRVLLAISDKTMKSIELDKAGLSELIYRLQHIKHNEMRKG